MLKYIVSVSYNKFIFKDDCAAMAFANVAKKYSEDDDLRVEISIETVKKENVVEEKEGEDE